MENMKLNPAYTERITGFNPQVPMLKAPPEPGVHAGPRRPANPEELTSPVELMENGDVAVRVMAPGAKRVTVESARLAVWAFDIALKDVNGKGLFEAILPASLGLAGNVVLQFRVDGVPVVISNIPVMFYGFQIVNYIEVPDPEANYCLIHDVPHGAITRELYWSEAMNGWQSCFVYTPPGYERGADYPVLYLQHGGAENETAWSFNGKLPNILDNVLADKSGVPFVAVMCDGMVKFNDRTDLHEFAAIEQVISQDCRTFIEDKYKVRRDKWGRAIAGLSLGSMQACYIGMRHPELYGAVGSFTYIRCRDTDNTHAGNPHLNCLKNPGQFSKDYKLFFRSIGDKEAHLCEFEADDAFIAACGIDRWSGYVRRIYPNQIHNWNCWRRAIYDFAQLVFKW